MEIDIYTEFNNDLENIWVMFEKDAVMTPFQSYAWLLHWQNTIGGPLQKTNPQIVLIRKKGKKLPKKPIIIISPDFLKVKALSKISRAYCNALGIDMTSHSIFSSMKKPNLDLDEKLYKKYINDYFCDLKNPSNTYTPKELTNFILNINP